MEICFQRYVLVRCFNTDLQIFCMSILVLSPVVLRTVFFFFVGRNMFIDAIIFLGGFILMLMVSQGPFNLPFVCSTDMSIYSRQSVASFFIHTFVPLISHY